MKPIVVQKYGGSSVADVDKIRNVAKRIVKTKEDGYHVVAVVSAMGSSTDNLLKQAYAISESPPKRELDMLLSVGERISISLMTMAISELGYDSISFTGSQCGIITSDNHSNARIIDVRPVRILDELARDRIVIIAGFQGMSYKREITTLGRGGSDTTAVALAAALDAKYCEICSDVDGVYTSDPRIVDNTSRIDELSYDEMEEMGIAGAGVLNPDAIDFARSRGLKVILTSTFKDGTGTLLLQREEEQSHPCVRAIALQRKLYRLQMELEAEDHAQCLLRIFGDMKIPIESMSVEGSSNPLLTVYLSPDRVPDWKSLRTKIEADTMLKVRTDENQGAVSLVGLGISEQPSVVEHTLALLASQGVAYSYLDLVRHRLTLYLDRALVEQIARILHKEFLPSIHRSGG